MVYPFLMSQGASANPHRLGLFILQLRNGGSDRFWGASSFSGGEMKILGLSGLHRFALHHFGVPNISVNGPEMLSLIVTITGS